ncbi:uncharacterized protein Z518_01165 [Rhinocladiella mackenziei CBS 650.93]|uniref:Rhinocladiella mackenziei CBS 650.93 unplaced genomic scaffold supercont1.1, whole genome shotgun sequence n=1 Tax=Rhinocladiella mackenziei CBS 650.93 TaxID=1442369 RepID=A0A0D2IVM3_9EURO|nr:uncharacterized protein Z518_01165 [Rhinocladiella mackenziei CBS 650.93]KIX10084.1 hypothetical protein Z518_01165 [Rhinocladiella mackenziei CBS 650.93]
MATEQQMESTDVIICGCGPTGALLSALLGQMSVQNVVLEKEKEIVTDPRGIALDEDGIRILQGLGIYDKIYTEIGTTIGWVYFTSGKHGLKTKPFMRMNLSSTEGGTGHPAAICHKQPAMEKNIRLTASRCSCSQLRLGSTIVAIEEDRDWVRAKYVDDNGQTKWIRGKFLVGADGKTGFTRKHYLEAKGVLLETVAGYHYQETWVALNWHMDLPTPESHPDFPLWKLGYTPQQVYDTFFPHGFRFIGNPDRPSVCGSFGHRDERLWRFEFVVEEGEDPQAMACSEKTMQIIVPYLTHPGSIYGLKDPVQYPADCIHVLRSRPFTFSARSCNKWAVGRVILCGDSAHVMPPFGGQGIVSGFRDASGVAWRLALTCRPNFDRNHESLFTGWYLERKQQLDRSLAATVVNGNFTTARNPVKIFIRDWVLWFMQLIPSVRHKLELGPRAEGMIKYKWAPGMAFLPDLGGGLSLPQVYCRSVFHSPKGGRPKVQFTDDVIYGPGSNSLLRLLVLVDDLEQAERSRAELTALNLESISDGEVKADEAAFLILSPSVAAEQTGASPAMSQQRIYRIATGDEFAASELCQHRPKPTGYDMYRIKKEVEGRKYILARPDRFIFAACRSGKELVNACERISTTLLGSSEIATLPDSKL